MTGMKFDYILNQSMLYLDNEHRPLSFRMVVML